MTVNKKISFETYINKRFTNSNINDIDELVKSLYIQFANSEESQQYIIEKYIKTKEKLIMHKSSQDNLFLTQFQSKNRNKPEISICEHLNFLSY